MTGAVLRMTAVVAAALVVPVAAGQPAPRDSGRPAAAGAPGRLPLGYRVLRQDIIINADIWVKKPEMMAAGLGFTSIIGVPGLSTHNIALSRTLAVLAGGTWNDSVHCAPGETPSLSSYTSAATPSAIRWTYGQKVYYSDGLPVEFSWPLLPGTLGPRDFRVSLSNGTTVSPQVASIWPNFEYNERSVAVLFGHFGNRVPPSEPGAIYPVSVQVVRRRNTLELVGPGQRIVSAAGFSVRTRGSPYTSPGVPPAQRGGPVLAAAKLTKMSAVGNSGPKIFQQNLPNDGVALYGKQAKFRLRIYTTGGMTPNGVSPLLPTEYSKFFRITATTAAGKTVQLTKTGKTYYIDGHPLRVLGLADLGKKQQHYGACYGEVRNNYIDIVLSGSQAAARRITTIDIPSTGHYAPLYNPGGPGTNPAPGVHYSAPSPPLSQHVIIALNNPMTVTYIRCPAHPLTPLPPGTPCHPHTR